MSKVSIDMCDIKGCRNEAYRQLDVMVVAIREDDGGLNYSTHHNVDLCGHHEMEYRTDLPEITVERKASEK